MAVKQPIFGRAMFCDAAVTAGQLVKITGDESVSPAAAGTDVVVGQALATGAIGEKVTIELFCKGIVDGVAAGAITAGAKVSGGTAGKFKAFTTGDEVIGVALNGVADAATVKVMVK